MPERWLVFFSTFFLTTIIIPERKVKKTFGCLEDLTHKPTLYPLHHGLSGSIFLDVVQSYVSSSRVGALHFIVEKYLRRVTSRLNCINAVHVNSLQVSCSRCPQRTWVDLPGLHQRLQVQPGGALPPAVGHRHGLHGTQELRHEAPGEVRDSEAGGFMSVSLTTNFN